MKIFFTYQGKDKNKFFLEFEVAHGTNVKEVLLKKECKEIISKINHSFKIGVDGEILDGKFNPKPEQYRLKEGERIEIYRDLTQDPKDRRISKL
jgi:putative ubiquitin-RnfH superfamily antitoxin RatB of RatAB toxin-antitoxin module